MGKITWEMSAEEAVGSARAAFIKKIYEMAKTDDSICLVHCDCSPEGSVQAIVGEDFGDRFIDTGIMEQNACGMAAGLALSGKTVFVQAFGPFMSTRAIEFVYLDGAYNDAPVTYIGTHCGVTAAAGPTHAAVLDIAFMRNMPNMTIVSPADAGQIEKVMEAAVHYPHPMYVRCARGEEPLVYKDNDYDSNDILLDGITEPEAIKVLAAMVPPIGVTLGWVLSKALKKKIFTKQEEEAIKVAFPMGLCMISEGVIPIAMNDLVRTVISTSIGCGVCGAISFTFGVGSKVPSGGVFVIPAMSNPLVAVIALLAGSCVTAILLNVLKKRLTDEEYLAGAEEEEAEVDLSDISFE